MEEMRMTPCSIVPLPKTDYCTITLDHYIDLVRAQQKLELLMEIVNNGKSYVVSDVLEILSKENNNGQ